MNWALARVFWLNRLPRSAHSALKGCRQFSQAWLGYPLPPPPTEAQRQYRNPR